jgi:MFS family permease
LPASTPDLAASFGLSVAKAAALALVAPLALSLLLEPRLLLAAERARDRRGYVRLGVAALALLALALVLAPTAWMAALALALLEPFWSAGLGTAQAALVAAAPAEIERTMTRWTLAASLGDLTTPVLLGVVALAGAGWRAAFVVVALAALASAALLPRLPARPEVASDEPTPRLAAALRRPRLCAWVAGAWLCCLLDEIFVAFAALALHSRLGASAGGRALVIGAFLGGGALALVVVERFASRDGRRLLAAFSLVGALVYVAWLLAPSLAWSAGLAALVGATTAPQYPLAKAQAYRATPDHPALVNALDALLGPLDVALPFALALLAAHAGVMAVLALLVLQPLLLSLLAWHVAPLTRGPHRATSDDM